MAIWERILGWREPSATNAPASFGVETAWLAADADPDETIDALGLVGTERSTWSRGLFRARRDRVFVAPRIGRWTLAVAASLPAPSAEHPDPFSRWLVGLGSALGSEVQVFWNHSARKTWGWARTRGGAIDRVYYVVGGRTVAQIGLPCGKEDALGIDYPPSPDDPPGTWERGGRKPNAGAVYAMAERWSVNPLDLRKNPRFPRSDGVIGRFP